MVSLFGRGFDSLQLHFITLRGLTLVRVLSVASLCESGKAEHDSLQLHFRIHNITTFFPFWMYMPFWGLAFRRRPSRL